QLADLRLQITELGGRGSGRGGADEPLQGFCEALAKGRIEGRHRHCGAETAHGLGFREATRVLRQPPGALFRRGTVSTEGLVDLFELHPASPISRWEGGSDLNAIRLKSSARPRSRSAAPSQ